MIFVDGMYKVTTHASETHLTKAINGELHLTDGSSWTDSVPLPDALVRVVPVSWVEGRRFFREYE